MKNKVIKSRGRVWGGGHIILFRYALLWTVGLLSAPPAQGRAAQGRAEQGRAGEGSAGQRRAAQGRAGQATARRRISAAFDWVSSRPLRYVVVVLSQTSLTIFMSIFWLLRCRFGCPLLSSPLLSSPRRRRNNLPQCCRRYSRKYLTGSV